MRKTQGSPAVVAPLCLAPLGAALLLLISLLVAGCDGSRQPTGSARLEAWATNGADIARVTATVSKGDGSNFDPITSSLERNGAQWWGHIEQIPAGKRRQFDVVAHGANGAVLCSVTTRSDIKAGVETLVSALLQLEVPLPIIDVVTASQCEVRPSSTVHVAATAHDPEGGPVTYLWTASCGSFDDPSKAAATWTAPDAEATCRLSVTVANRVEGSVTASLEVAVRQSPGGANVEVHINHWPLIGSFTAAMALGATLEGDLNVEASDPDGDPLTYLWTSTCPALTFNVEAPRGGASPHFSLPAPSDACTIVLTVADPNGGHTPATMTVPPNKGFGTGM